MPYALYIVLADCPAHAVSWVGDSPEWAAATLRFLMKLGESPNFIVDMSDITFMASSRDVCITCIISLTPDNNSL